MYCNKYGLFGENIYTFNFFQNEKLDFYGKSPFYKMGFEPDICQPPPRKSHPHLQAQPPPTFRKLPTPSISASSENVSTPPPAARGGGRNYGALM